MLAVGVPDDVHARDVGIDAAGDVHAHHLAPVLGVAVDALGGDAPGAHDVAAVVDVVQEEVQRLHALAQPARQALPAGAGDDVRDDVERDQPLGARGLAVDGEGDADAVEEQVGGLPVLRDASRRRALQPLGKSRVMRPDRPLLGVHLVEQRRALHP